MAQQNPLLKSWNTPFELPPFAEVKTQDFREAFDKAIELAKADIDAVAENPDTPDFKNTIEALELSGETLSQVSSVFFNLSGAHTNPEHQAIEREFIPKLSEFNSSVKLNQKLFDRISHVYENSDDASLNPEQLRVLELYYKDFVKQGAKLSGGDRSKMADIMKELAGLGTSFSQNILADESAYELILDKQEDLAGLPDFLISAARSAAEERGHEGKYVITLSRSLIEPFLQFSQRRDLREQAFKAWISRGEMRDESNNHAIIKKTLSLREQRAQLLGFETFADYKLEDQMAKTPAAVRELLENVWTPAVARAREEKADLQELANKEGANFEVQAWDWRYYSEQLRKIRHDLDEAEIKPYFQLDKMIEAAFETANRLFGLTFKEHKGIKTYHPDARVFEVLNRDGAHQALFIGDYFARQSKRSGAWMSGFRSQQKLKGNIAPIIVNVMNFAKAPDGEATLLTYDDARTLFHEFGHALHGMLSNVTYPRISGTSVARDFVELPSQLFEHWMNEKVILEKYAIHAETGETMPDALIEKLKAASNFNQGFSTVEYTACALVDLAVHTMPADQVDDLSKLETNLLSSIDMPKEIVMRHRMPHFAHVFSGDGYSSGYYSYMWSEVMDADAFKAFEETGDAFDEKLAAKLHDHIYSAGGSKDPAELYTAFRGKMPSIDALLEGRGLKDAA